MRGYVYVHSHDKGAQSRDVMASVQRLDVHKNCWQEISTSENHVIRMRRLWTDGHVLWGASPAYGDTEELVVYRMDLRDNRRSKGWALETRQITGLQSNGELFM